MSNDVIGRGVIEVVTDATKLTAGINASKTSLQSLRDAAKDVGESLSSGSIAYLRQLEKQANAIEKQAASFGKSKSEIASLNAAQQGVSSTAATFVERIRAGEQALKDQAAAAREVALANARLSEGQNFLKGLQGQVDGIGKTSSQLLELKAAQLGLTTQAAPLIAALAAEEKGLNRLGPSAKQVALQHQIAAVQVKDFIEQVLAGGSPIRAFAQQGTAVVSTYGGLGATLRSLGSLISPLVLGIGATAAAVGGLAFAFHEGEQQSQAFAKGLQLTGNFAGQTEGQFNALAKSVAASTGETIGNVREIAQALLNTGEVGPQVFDKATAAAVGYAKATGKSADDVAKAFARMADSPSKFAAEANKQLNFITAAQYQAIKAFEENGRAADAQGVIYDALIARFPKVTQNLGYLDGALQVAKSAWSAFWNSAYDVGRKETIEDRLAKAQRAVAAAQPSAPVVSPGGAAFVGQSAGRRQSTAQTIAAAAADDVRDELASKLFQRQQAEAAAADKERQKAGIAARDYGEAALKSAKDVSALNKELAENARQFKAAAAAGTPFTAAQQKAVDDQTRKRFAPSGGGRGRVDHEPDQVRKAQLDADLKFLHDKQREESDSIAFHSQELAALYAAGNVSLHEFYDARNKEIADGLQHELNLLSDEQARLEVELTRENDPSKRIDLQRQIDAAERKSTEVALDGARKRTLADHEETAAKKRLADQVVEFQADLLALQGNEFAAARLRDEQTVKRAKLLAEQSGGPAVDVTGLAGALQSRRELNNAEMQTSRINEVLAIQEERIGLAQRTGSIGEIAALEAQGAARRQAVSMLEEQLAIQERLSAEQPGNTGLAISVERTRLELDKLKADLDPLKDKFDSLFRDSAGSAIGDFLNHTKSAKDAIKGFGTAVSTEINNMIGREISGKLFGKDGVLGGAGGFLSGLFGDKAKADAKAASDPNSPFDALRGGIDPAVDALTRLQQAAEGAAGALSGAGRGEAAGGIRTMGDFARYDRSSNSGEQSIADLFKETDQASTSAAEFGKTAASATGDIARMAAAAGRGSSALGLLPSIINSIGGGSNGSTGGLIGSLITAAIGAFAGGGTTSGATGVVSSGAATGVPGYASNAGISGGRAGGGFVQPGHVYEVGEQGPELLRMGSRSGWVEPNSRSQSAAAGASAGQQRQIVMNIAMPQGATRETGQQFGAAAAQRLRAATARVG